MPSSQHPIEYSVPATTWDEGLPLGNAMLGALVWGDGNPLNISLDRADLWDLRPVPEFHAPEYSYATMRRWHEAGRHDDLIRVFEDPYRRPAPTKIPAGRIEISSPHSFSASTLNIANALASVEFEGGAKCEIFQHATQPLGVLWLRGSGAKFHLRAPDFGGEIINAAAGGIDCGDLSQLGYPPPQESSGENFQAFEQRGWDGFQFAVYLAWREDANGIFAAWSIVSSFEGAGVLDIARRRVEAALQIGFDPLLDSHRAWWRDFWEKSSLTLPDKQLEKQWFLET